MHFTRKTKIICTIGPATKSIELLTDLIKNGMDIARLNFSHGNYEEHIDLINNTRQAAASLDRNIPIIADLCGPKIRIGNLKEQVLIHKYQIVTLSDKIDLQTPYTRFQVTYENLSRDVKIGDKILIDDGLIELRVITLAGNSIDCMVVEGGIVRSKKGVNLPDSTLSTPSLTAKDKEDIDFALSYNLDFIALSFVRSSDDIIGLKNYLTEKVHSIPVIAKIEKPQAIADIDRIIESSDVIMIARGDLGVEMNSYEVPLLQKQIIRKCLISSKPVITATQMLESMITNPRCTRAEASDIANAVLDGTDAVMLSGETSIGSHPIAAVKIMHSIVQHTEQTEHINRFLLEDKASADDSRLAIELSKAACSFAQESNAALIIVMTKSGRTARYLAKHRIKTPIVAFSPNKNTIRELALTWGVTGVLIDAFGVTEETLAEAKQYAINHGYIKTGDVIVFVVGAPLLGTNEINMIKIDKY